jgi:hypothetical protein
METISLGKQEQIRKHIDFITREKILGLKPQLEIEAKAEVEAIKKDFMKSPKYKEYEKLRAQNEVLEEKIKDLCESIEKDCFGRNVYMGSSYSSRQVEVRCVEFTLVEDRNWRSCVRVDLPLHQDRTEISMMPTYKKVLDIRAAQKRINDALLFKGLPEIEKAIKELEAL